MKREWKKHEKSLYVPKTSPEIIKVPAMKYMVLSGEGNPNDAFFSEYIAALYAVSYAVRMSYKNSDVPEGYYEYTVYPLEGVWDFINPELREFDKNNLKFDLMIRQPDFLTEKWAPIYMESAFKKKKNPLIPEMAFKEYPEEKCVQMLHIGPYDNEPESFEKMSAFCNLNGLERTTHEHREIYITDVRKTAPEKNKTVLRYTVK
ncbi:GyrI-like domain-containing protein [Fusibacter ferrireducens]|uniref:GyrI-like domain-containing protein n=1 Tax=Fusibacter ferrireducens TaxID=2785058 RepID=A0ABR9ZRY3_9FIRM|nr:GyrI-like domain-containing protein [Fusibacter ferrireducens]MBF4692389.1 GyrI-like domain-containing protein [Fusibacter ferrireducens]